MWELVVEWGWSSQAFTELPSKGALVLEPATPPGLGTRGMEVGDSLLVHPATNGTGAEQ